MQFYLIAVIEDTGQLLYHLQPSWRMFMFDGMKVFLNKWELVPQCFHSNIHYYQAWAFANVSPLSYSIHPFNKATLYAKASIWSAVLFFLYKFGYMSWRFVILFWCASCKRNSMAWSHKRYRGMIHPLLWQQDFLFNYLRKMRWNK